MVQWAAGDRVTASKLSTTRVMAVCSAALLVTTTATDLTDLTSTFTTTRANVDVHVLGVLDAITIGADPVTGTLVGELVVDGSAQAAQILWNAGTDATPNDGNRATVSQSWLVTLASAGSHTIKMRASRVAGTAGDLNVNATHSTMSLTIEDNV